MTTDRFVLAVAALLGQPLPPLPALPGRVFAAHDEPLPADDREALLLSDATDAEVGRVLGLTRQRVGQVRRALRERYASEAET